MTGSSHFTIGCAAAGAVAFVGFQNGDMLLLASALTVPFGAMLPDIDHDKTKLGRKRMAVTGLIKKVVLGTIAFYLANAAYLILLKKQDPITVLTGSLMSVGPLILCALVTSNDSFKKHTKFYRRHRGIMHTLAPIVGLLIGAHLLKGSFISSLLAGVSIGYATHLIADMQTAMGCPLLWPLTAECIPGLPVRAGSKMETVEMLLDLGVIGCLVMLPWWH